MSRLNGACSMGLKSQAGFIEAGKLADLVVLDANLFGVTNERTTEIKVIKTVFEGKEIFTRE